MLRRSSSLANGTDCDEEAFYCCRRRGLLAACGEDAAEEQCETQPENNADDHDAPQEKSEGKPYRHAQETPQHKQARLKELRALNGRMHTAIAKNPQTAKQWEEINSLSNRGASKKTQRNQFSCSLGVMASRKMASRSAPRFVERSKSSS